MTVALALISSLLWGTSDFLGGTATRRMPSAAVVGVSQTFAMVGLIPFALAFGARPNQLLAGVAAGVAGMLALSLFYAALASGTMGVVAPIAAMGALLPVTVGLIRGEVPSTVQVAGIVVAVCGVILASGPELSARTSSRPLLLALGAAVGFGLVVVLITAGSKGPPGAVIVTLLIMRISSVGVLVPAFLVARAKGFSIGVARRDLVLLACIGLGDVGANACFAVASRHSLLSVVSVLGSLYPVVTVLLARQFHAERLRAVQIVGTLGTLGGIALLAAG